MGMNISDFFDMDVLFRFDRLVHCNGNWNYRC